MGAPVDPVAPETIPFEGGAGEVLIGAGGLYPGDGELVLLVSPPEGGGDLDFLMGLLEGLFPSWAFCCCLHFARRFLNQTWNHNKSNISSNNSNDDMPYK